MRHLNVEGCIRRAPRQMFTDTACLAVIAESAFALGGEDARLSVLTLIAIVFTATLGYRWT